MTKNIKCVKVDSFNSFNKIPNCKAKNVFRSSHGQVLAELRIVDNTCYYYIRTVCERKKAIRLVKSYIQMMEGH